ncbi:hypothetical protein OAX78_02725 [Planctomycetota bacterium]|nr:hypothetical protein [Planctomycetota bacterium]
MDAQGGGVLTPALPAPPVELAERIAAMAAEPYDVARDWARASRVGPELGPAQVEQLLAVAVNPPAVRGAVDPVAWVRRVQLTVAQVAAHLDTGWEGSVRREALLSLLLGPRDWLTEMAIVVLTQLVHDCPLIANPVAEAFFKLSEATPDSGAVPYEHTLYSHWLGFPNLYPNEREELQMRLEAIEQAQG